MFQGLGTPPSDSREGPPPTSVGTELPLLSLNLTERSGLVFSDREPEYSTELTGRQEFSVAKVSENFSALLREVAPDAVDKFTLRCRDATGEVYDGRVPTAKGKFAPRRRKTASDVRRIVAVPSEEPILERANRGRPNEYGERTALEPPHLPGTGRIEDEEGDASRPPNALHGRPFGAVPQPVHPRSLKEFTPTP